MHMNWFQGLSFKNQVLIPTLIFCMLLLLALSLSFLFIFQKSSDTLFESVLNSSISQLDASISTKFKHIITSNNYMLSDPTINKIVKTNHQDYNHQYINDVLTIERSLKQFVGTNEDIEATFIVNMNNNIYQHGLLTPKLITSLTLELDNRKFNSLMNIHTGTPFEFALTGSSKHFTIPLFTQIYDIHTTKPIGYSIILIRLDKILTNLLFDETDYINTHLTDASNNTLYTSDSKLFVHENTSLKDKMDRITLRKTNQLTNWVITQSLNTNIFFELIFSYILVAILIILATVLIVIFLANMISSRLSMSLHTLKAAFDECDDGNINYVRLAKANISNEMTSLITSYNSLIDRLKVNISKIQELEILNQKTIIRMLQAQISPHFLYNTLNLIASIAIINDIPEIYEITTAMSKLFRYNLNANKVVTLADELEQVNNYLTIRNYRFPMGIRLIIDIDENEKNTQIIPFILQPIVENSLIHGFKENIPNKSIRITLEYEKDVKIIKVIDNGVGMQSKKLSDLRESLRMTNISETRSSFGTELGLSNVHDRLKLYYGTDYGLYIDSIIGQGTIVTVRFPRYNDADTNC